MARYENFPHVEINTKYGGSKLPSFSMESLEIINIADSKVSKEKKRYYLVCLQSWFPEDELNNCQEMIEEYWRKQERNGDNWQNCENGGSDKENDCMSPISRKNRPLLTLPQIHSASDYSCENDKLRLNENITKNKLTPKDGFAGSTEFYLVKPEVATENNDNFDFPLDVVNNSTPLESNMASDKHSNGLGRASTSFEETYSSVDENNYNLPSCGKQQSESSTSTPLLDEKHDLLNLISRFSNHPNGGHMHMSNLLHMSHGNIQRRSNLEERDASVLDDDLANRAILEKDHPSLYNGGIGDNQINGQTEYSDFGAVPDEEMTGEDSDASESEMRISDETATTGSFFDEADNNTANRGDDFNDEISDERADMDNKSMTSSYNIPAAEIDNKSMINGYNIPVTEMDKKSSTMNSYNIPAAEMDNKSMMNSYNIPAAEIDNKSSMMKSYNIPAKEMDNKSSMMNSYNIPATEMDNKNVINTYNTSAAEMENRSMMNNYSIPAAEMDNKTIMNSCNIPTAEIDSRNAINSYNTPVIEMHTKESDAGETVSLNSSMESHTQFDGGENTYESQSAFPRSIDNTVVKPLGNSDKAANVKKRKGKTLDDIVRKISNANEQAAERKLSSETLNDEMVRRQGIASLWKHPGDDLENAMKKKDDNHNGEVCERKEKIDGNALEPGDGKREANIYWSAGKAFRKPNLMYKCKFCDHRFDDENLLKKHERSQYSHHQCRNCNEIFSSSIELSQHREVVHAFKPRQRYNKCRFCPTLYADPLMLQRHEEIHHLSRPPNQNMPTSEKNSELPPPLVSIQESQKFAKYDHPREFTVAVNGSKPSGHLEPLPHDEKKIRHDDEVSDSVVRKPVRHLLKSMYQSQKRHENPDDRFPPNVSAFDPRISPPPLPPHQLYYGSYPYRFSLPLEKAGSVSEAKEMKENSDERRSNNGHIDEKESKFHELLHICRICKKSFGKKETLAHHFSTAHESETAFVCDICHEVCLNKEELDTHMKTHLKQDFYCCYCRTVYDCKSTFESHMREHNNDRPFRCHICGRAFSLRTNLRRHVLVHTDITPHRCHVCFKGFRRSDMLNSHIKQYHGVEDNKKGRSGNSPESRAFNDTAYANENHRMHGITNNSSASPVYQPQSRNSSPHSGPIDSNNLNGDIKAMRESPSPNLLIGDTEIHHIKHKMDHSPDATLPKDSPANSKIHYPSSAPPPIDSFDGAATHHNSTTSSQSNHLPKMVPLHHLPNEHAFHHRNGIPQSICSDRSPHQLIPSIPMGSEARYSPYKPKLVTILPQMSFRLDCNECGEKFTSESLYEIHVQSHVKEVAFTCSKCHRTFNDKSQYNSHMQTHENNKSHSCPYCHRSFSMKGNLRRHIRIHTNEAPYECPICFQRFRRSDGLKGHIKRHDALGESVPGDMVPSQASA